MPGLSWAGAVTSLLPELLGNQDETLGGGGGIYFLKCLLDRLLSLPSGLGASPMSLWGVY